MSPQLDSTTGTTPSNNVKCDTPATQTCNCCLLVRDFSTWNHVKSTEDSWNEVPKTGSKLDVVSRLFRFSPVAPPSHHVRPVTSVPSLGGRSLCRSSPRRRRLRPAAPGPPPGGRSKPQSPGAHRLSQRVPGKVTGDHVPTRNTYQQHVSKHLKTKISLNWIGKSKLRTYNNLFNLQAYPFSGVRLLRRLAPGSGGPPAASVGQLRRCLLSQPARCLRLKTAETLDVWRCKVYS